eukprot:924158-Amphidinium_carterae.1
MQLVAMRLGTVTRRHAVVIERQKVKVESSFVRQTTTRSRCVREMKGKWAAVGVLSFRPVVLRASKYSCCAVGKCSLKRQSRKQ